MHVPAVSKDDGLQQDLLPRRHNGKRGGGERESCVKSAKRSVRLGLLRRAGCRSVDQLVYPVSANAQLAESRYK